MLSEKELETLTMSYLQEHGDKLGEMASMAYLSRRLLYQFAVDQGVNLDALLAWQDRMVTGYALQQGIAPETLRGAVAALEQAGRAAAHLTALSLSVRH